MEFDFATMACYSNHKSISKNLASFINYDFIGFRSISKSTTGHHIPWYYYYRPGTYDDDSDYYETVFLRDGLLLWSGYGCWIRMVAG